MDENLVEKYFGKRVVAATEATKEISAKDALSKLFKYQERIERAAKQQNRTLIKKGEFLDIYGRTLGSIKATCLKVGISRKTYYNWLNNDPDFREAIEGTKVVTYEFIEEQLNKLILRGNGWAVRYWLSRHHPAYKKKRSLHDIIYLNDNSPFDLTDEEVGRLERAGVKFNGPRAGNVCTLYDL